jgi:hypothetical protein
MAFKMAGIQMIERVDGQPPILTILVSQAKVEVSDQDVI